MQISNDNINIIGIQTLEDVEGIIGLILFDR